MAGQSVTGRAAAGRVVAGRVSMTRSRASGCQRRTSAKACSSATTSLAGSSRPTHTSVRSSTVAAAAPPSPTSANRAASMPGWTVRSRSGEAPHRSCQRRAWVLPGVISAAWAYASAASLPWKAASRARTGPERSSRPAVLRR